METRRKADEEGLLGMVAGTLVPDASMCVTCVGGLTQRSQVSLLAFLGSRGSVIFLFF